MRKTFEWFLIDAKDSINLREMFTRFGFDELTASPQLAIGDSNLSTQNLSCKTLRALADPP